MPCYWYRGSCRLKRAPHSLAEIALQPGGNADFRYVGTGKGLVTCDGGTDAGLAVVFSLN